MIDPDAFNAFEVAGWEDKAAGYDRFFGRITGRLVEPLLDAAAVGPSTRTLDVATGPGYVAARAAERGASVIGIDVAEAMVSLAKRLHPGLEFRQADAQGLPFDDASFDAVVGNFLILHLGRPERATAEFARVLRPDGRLALTAWDLPEHARFLGVFRDAVAEARAQAPDDVPVGPDFFRFSVDGEFDALLREAGLEDRTVQTIAFTHGVANADELWDGLLGGTVRTSALILHQPEETQQRIRTAFDELVASYRRGDALELPVSVKLAAGRKPSAG
ncbi:MAG TPA: class I SAM-dependent methyltransferase [Solirubrobacterales bacterium]|jgi:ubiquinone/menaquinone biosynthesis C-methylase UbiE|nr:class I SAM-dependent methyltransferase [Solirubrobacterales bacterium]